jgi:hypothetical protein
VKESYFSKYLCIDGKVILKLIISKRGGRMWTGFAWLGVGTTGEVL